MMVSMTTVLCPCGTRFSTRTAAVKRGWGKYCSKSCKQTYQNVEERLGNFDPATSITHDEMREKYQSSGLAMTTNQTIDGVPRELVEWAYYLSCAMGYRADPRTAQLRALLDKEVSGDSRAPLPQGEPVALPKVLPLDDPRCPRHHLIADGFRSGADWMRREVEKLGPLYAKQPAPVAVVLPERMRHRSENPAARISFIKGWNACLDEVTRLNTNK